MRFLVGSNYFFSKYNDYILHDTDYVELLDNDVGNFYYEKRLYDKELHADIFQIKRFKTKEEQIEECILYDKPIAASAYLIPEIVNELNIEISDLKKLEIPIRRCFHKHHYIQVIYDFYIQNNSFTLTDEQRLIAYEDYKSYHPEIYKKEESK